MFWWKLLASDSQGIDEKLNYPPHQDPGATTRAVHHKIHHNIPRHIQKIKNQVEERRKQSLSSLNGNLKPANGIISEERPLAIRKDKSFSESSETESQQDVGFDFVGFKKTRDFGDFVTFSNSPSQIWVVSFMFVFLLISASKKTLLYWKRLQIAWN